MSSFALPSLPTASVSFPSAPLAAPIAPLPVPIVFSTAAQNVKPHVDNKPFNLMLTLKSSDGSSLTFTLAVKISEGGIVKRRVNEYSAVSEAFLLLQSAEDDLGFAEIKSRPENFGKRINRRNFKSRVGTKTVVLSAAKAAEFGLSVRLTAANRGTMTFVTTKGGNTQGRVKQNYVLLQASSVYHLQIPQGFTVHRLCVRDKDNQFHSLCWAQTVGELHGKLRLSEEKSREQQRADLSRRNAMADAFDQKDEEFLPPPPPTLPSPRFGLTIRPPSFSPLPTPITSPNILPHGGLSLMGGTHSPITDIMRGPSGPTFPPSWVDFPLQREESERADVSPALSDGTLDETIFTSDDNISISIGQLPLSESDAFEGGEETAMMDFFRSSMKREFPGESEAI